MKRLAGYTAIVLATLAGLALLWQFRLVVLLFILSLFVAASIRPVVLRMHNRGLPRSISVLLVFAAGLVLLIVLFALAGGPLLAELQTLTNRLAIAYETNYTAWVDGTAVQQAIARQIVPPTVLYDTIGGPDGELMFEHLGGITLPVVSVLGGVVLILVMSIYWTIDQARFERLWLSLLPAGRRTTARDSWRAVETAVGSYLRSEITQGFLAGVALAIGYRLLGLDYPITLGLVGALVWFVPLLGSILITVPVFLVGLSQSLVIAMVAVAFTLAVLLVLELVVEPYLFNKRHYSSVLTLLLMLPLVDALGLLGFVAAPPLAAALQTLGGQIFQQRQARNTMAVQLSSVEERLQAVRASYGNGRQMTPEVESILERLEGLIKEARQVTRRSRLR